jgi:N-hydroxyarylamine O-acetyltransferase
VPVTPPVQAYLDRIGYAGSTAPDLATLAALQRAHMLSVPFENLDIHLGRRLVLDPVANHEKIVGRGRGGWCFELNGLFGWLLEQIGFDVTLLGARVNTGEERGSDLAHLLLRVDLAEPYIADVGFGEGAFEPVPLAGISDGVIAHQDGHRVVFTQQPRSIDEFQPMCDHLQTSADSVFVRSRFAVLALPDGRIKLRGDELIEQHGDAVTTRVLGCDDEWRAVLRDRFGVVLDQSTSRGNEK